MNRVPMNIFLHFLNRDTQEIYGITAEGIPQICAKIQKGLNASVLLCDADTYCFLPLGFWFESRYTRQLLAASGAFIEDGYIRFSAREDTLWEFIEKKRKQYYAFRKASNAYQDFFDDAVLRQLSTLGPILMERQAKIGEYCSELWYDSHSRLIDDNSGDLVALYAMVKDTTDRMKIAKTMSAAANSPESPFIWKKVRDLIDNLKIRDQRLERRLRFYFEKSYYQVYLEEYHASNLYAFYPIDRGIDFQLEMPATSIANYMWLEGFLRYLQLEWILSMPAGEVAQIRRMPAWLFLQKKYIAACNGLGRFDDNVCEMLQLSPDRNDINNAAVEVAKNLKEKKNVIILPPMRSANPIQGSTERSISIMSNKVFIVHGHDDAAKLEMARTLEKAGFEAIILHEQPDEGRTIIEKFENYADVSFAVILYTECDLGRAKETPVDSEKYRARQNVVFEHGFFLGKLGRGHVCALVKGDIEVPGDLSGVVYVNMDKEGAWKMKLASNMRAAGLPVDMNKFF